MNHPSTAAGLIPEKRLGIAMRLSILGGLFLAEKIFLNTIVQFEQARTAQGLGAIVRVAQHWGLRFLVAFAAATALFTCVRTGRNIRAQEASIRAAPIRLAWVSGHFVLLAILVPLSYVLYRYTASELSYAIAVALWILLAGGSAIMALAAMAPLSLWRDAGRALGVIWWYAALAAVLGTGAMQWSQMLWQPTADITFDLVRRMLSPLLPTLVADPTALTLSTDRFSIQIAEVCSGLEGVGMMLAFSGAWLLYFRREYIFPRAVVLIPVSLLIVFALNAVRIAALMLIGYGGYPEVAIYGFHSQAGWIAFIAVACGFVLWSRRSAWLNRVAAESPAAAEPVAMHNPTAVYLMPLLAILGAGAVSHALSGTFEYFYPLRLLAGLWMLARYRRDLAALAWRCTWRGPLVGALVFLVWMAASHFLLPEEPMPGKLAALPPALRGLWILSRIAGSALLVPVAEELAYRGYLMRRWVNADFESVSFESIRWPALILTAIVFGLVHGALWLPGIAAGLAYGLILIRRGRIGEAVAAHATTNALIVIAVLAGGQWQLW
jgi:exosortase E/protease (VPEID-CTERM system)